MRQLALLSMSCLIGWIASAETAFAEGRLARARREVEGSDHPQPRVRPPPAVSRARPIRVHETRPVAPTHWHDHGFAPPPSGCGPSCATLVYAPDGGEYVDESTPVPPSLPQTYASYPYASSRSTYLLEPDLQSWAVTPVDASGSASTPDSAVGRAWAGQLSLDAGYLLGIMHGNWSARLLTPSRFELALRGTLMYEPSLQDRAQVVAAELGLRVLQLDWLMVRLFAAAQSFDQGGGLTQYGGELGIDLDLFLGAPWVVSLRGAGALLGVALVSTVRVQLGYLFERYEIFVAYQDFRIGGVDLSSPLVGLRVWL